ncbi:MAG: NAD(P)-dependent oxidoreductase [Rhodoferax sp.]|nr:NAD(P)-dependent oxidoreductase [Rhodoferax sp.]
MKVAVLGLGLMGLPMAGRLCRAGLEVHVWNRTAAKAEPLQALGAVAHASAAQAMASADLIITMLEHGQAVEAVLLDPSNTAALRSGSLVVDMSSIAPAQARAHALALQALGVRYLDAPVSGGTLGAEQGTLAIMAGGAQSDLDEAHTALSHLGRATLVGPHGCGQLAKLANQMIVGITIGAVAEALLLCEKGGANMAKVKEAITGGFADSRILQVHGQRMVERDFAPRGRMSVQLKDMRNALSTAETIGFDAPVTALLEQLYAQANENGLSGLDQAALFVELARRNGMA